MILDAANSVIKNNKERKDMELYSNLGLGTKVKYLKSKTTSISSVKDKDSLSLINSKIKFLNSNSLPLFMASNIDR